MLTSIVTGPLALEFVREASVVGTAVFGLGALVVTGFGAVTGFFVVTGAWVFAGVLGVVVGAKVVSGADVEAGTVTAGSGALVVAGAVGAGVGAGVDGGLGGIEGNRSVGSIVVEDAGSCAAALSIVPASTEALSTRTPKREVRKHRGLCRAGSRKEVFTS